MNKKAIIFMPLLLIVVIYILVTGGLKFMSNEKVSFTEEIGDIQNEVIKTYQEGEFILFYVDESSKYAIGYATYELAQKGGLTNSKCGAYGDYNLWKSGSQECYLTKETLTKSFGTLLNNQINQFLEAYELEMPQDNYEIEINGFTIAKAKEPIVLEKGNIKYSISPSFKSSIKPNFEDFLEISPKAEELASKCQQDINCWKENTKDWETKTSENGKVFMFDVNTHKKMAYFDQEVMVKFAINFEETNPLFENV